MNNKSSLISSLIDPSIPDLSYSYYPDLKSFIQRDIISICNAGYLPYLVIYIALQLYKVPKPFSFKMDPHSTILAGGICSCNETILLNLRYIFPIEDTCLIDPILLSNTPYDYVNSYIDDGYPCKKFRHPEWPTFGYFWNAPTHLASILINHHLSIKPRIQYLRYILYKMGLPPEDFINKIARVSNFITQTIRP